MSLQQMLQMGRGYQMPQMQPMQPMQRPMMPQAAVPSVGPGSVPPPAFTPPQPGGGLAEFLARSRRTHNAPANLAPQQPLVRPLVGNGPTVLMPGAR